MKSLLDIQKELRNLESSVADINDCIKNIGSDIEELRSAEQGIEIDYQKIEGLARHISLSKHPLRGLQDGAACQIYLEMLLNIIRLDREKELILNRLVFIQWLQMEAQIDWTLEDLLKDCYTIEAASYYEILDCIPKIYRRYFIVDALIVAGLGGAANAEIYQYIADLAVILGIDAEQMRRYSLVARVALCQSFKGLTMEEMSDFIGYAKSFNCYISKQLMENAMKSMRRIIVRVPDEGTHSFKWHVQQGKSIRKGDLVASYFITPSRMAWSSALREKGTLQKIKAESAGTIFQFRDNCINYGVLGYKGDNKDSIKKWVKSGEAVFAGA